MKVLRLSDRIEVKFETFTIKVKPLSFEERSVIESFNKIVSGEVVTDWNKVLFHTIKYCIADISGLMDFNGSEIKCDFKDSYISDDMVSIIFNSAMREDILRTIRKIEDNPESFILGHHEIESIKGVKLGN
jgi:hypothetical protein